MIIGGTFFDHKDIYKGTWISPDGRTVNQIDHVLLDGRHKSDLQDVRVYRSANMDSDHYLVIAKLRAIISNNRNEKGIKTVRYNTEMLKEEEIKRRFEEVTNEKIRQWRLECREEQDIENHWLNLKNMLVTTGEEIVGLKKRHGRDEWFDKECEEATDFKNKTYKFMIQRKCTRAVQEEYRKARRREKKIHRGKKREYMMRQMEKIEEYKSKRLSRDMYRKVNDMRQEFQPRTNACRDNNGGLVSDNAGVIRRWTEHFEELLGSVGEASMEASENEEEVGEFEDDREELVPSYDEVYEALEKLKNNKAAGSDGLPGELLKSAGGDFIKEFAHLIERIWLEEVMPDEWNNGVVCLIHKKGDPLICKNYRGISLLNTAYKVLSNIIFSRLLPYAEENIKEYQCGFTRNRSTTCLLYTSRCV